jgi:hypothetical protein
LDLKGFDGDAWERAIGNISLAQEPTLFLGLEEDIIQAMTIEAMTGSNQEIDRIEKIILRQRVQETPLIHPFLEASKEAIQGAAETLRNLREPIPEQSSEVLITRARREPNPKKRLKIVGHLGLRIIHGDPAEIVYSIPDGTLKNWLMGAKTARNMMIMNGFDKI